MQSLRASDVNKLYNNDRCWKILQLVRDIADRNSVSCTQVALAWLLQRPAVISPVVGVNSVEQLREFFGAIDVFLSIEDMAELNKC
ncbi:hypothetical protein AA106_07925 [Photorhabdus laumondii subsp. laumondii]|uniref:aldo/keto reductase n=1 Tax=Photorhabdus laumondii TaxID=2218628 RepID=UPI000733526B|nr:aldo/keto reductase [Photorhabdus laumondii]KTL61696.1 hypothetical protein AA106_07925 [Photorhabdus laumondii subsp. laumondii]